MRSCAAAAERDLRQMQVQAGELFARLVTEHRYAPELHWWAGHDHFTPGASLGTLNVDGDLVLSSSSTFELELTGDASDRLHATGTATLAITGPWTA